MDLFDKKLGDIESNANKPVAWNISALPQYKDSDVEYQVTLSVLLVAEFTTVKPPLAQPTTKAK